MATLLNLALALVATISTGAAFGGKTWLEGPEPILKRITRRGWVSLACLAMTFGMGIWKQINDIQSTDQANQRHLTELADSKKETEELKEKLSAANLSLNAATVSLYDLNTLNREMANHLTDQGKALDLVGENLGQTRSDLIQQSNANLVAALGNANLVIRQVSFYLPLTGLSPKPHNLQEVFIPEGLVPNFCQVTTGYQILIQNARGQEQALDHSPDDDQALSWSMPQSWGRRFPWADGLSYRGLKRSEKDFDNFNRLIGQQSSDGAAYVLGVSRIAETAVATTEFSVAGLVGSLTEHNATPVEISTIFPFRAKTDNGERDFGGYRKQFRDPDNAPFPPSCARQVRQHFETAFQNAALIITIEGKDSEAIMFRLKAQAVKQDDRSISVSFVVDSLPIVIGSGNPYEDAYFKIIDGVL